MVRKENRGQLSAFNESLKHITGDIVFQLDADDRYKKTYVEEIINIYKERNDIDFIFCEMEKFFIDGRKEIKLNKKYKFNSEVGYSIISTLYVQEWIGSPTSAISMRTELYKKLLPVPYEKDWITRADDCLVLGASILGANKYYYSNALVEYRIHGSNAFFNKKFSKKYEYNRKINLNRLINFFHNKSNLGDDISDIIQSEFLTRDYGNIRIYKFYSKAISKQNFSSFKKLRLKIKLFGYFAKKNLKNKKVV